MARTTSTQEPDDAPQLAVLDSFSKSHVPLHARAARLAHADSTQDATATAPVITLRVEPRRARLAAFTLATITLIVFLTILFQRGVQLTQFESSHKNAAARGVLLDNYNAYSGSVASAFAMPVEVFVSLAAQLVVLRFLASAATHSTPNASVTLAALALSGALGYLISNSLNALNVQLRPLDIVPAIGASDLAIQLDFIGSRAATQTTNLTHSVPETVPQNLLTNTLLRNLVLPAEPRRATTCMLSTFAVFRDHSVQYGVAQREWQQRALQQALPSAPQLRLVVNATATANASTTSPSRPEELPMSASRAAHLFAYAMFTAAGEQSLFPWGNTNAFARTSDVRERVRWPSGANANGTITFNARGPTVELTGLLPANHSTTSETDQRVHFLRELPDAVKRQFANATNTSRSTIALTFSHTQISREIVFDSLTIDVEMEPTLLATANANTTRFTFVDTLTARSFVPELAMVAKRPYRGRAIAFGDAAVFDALPQVHALAACLDAVNGTEVLPMVIGTIESPAKWTTHCPDRSNTSFYVFSVAKKLVADAFVAPTPGLKTAAATNLRKIYSFTIGRVAWTTTDLSTAFHAACKASDASGRGCQGLSLPLAKALGEAASNRPTQQLVVGAGALPVDKLPTFLEFRSFRTQALAQVNEPRQLDTAAEADPLEGQSPLAGDPMLVHNIADHDWQWSTTSECSDVTETRLQQVLDNHYYSENSLQPAYTAATFFLFQNAVVRDVVALSQNRETLRFDANVQPIAVWLSVPKQNAWLTLAGCVVLTVALVAVLLKSWHSATQAEGDPLAAITEPQAIARVMLDDRRFPPMLLHRRVVEQSASSAAPRTVDKFAIDALTLQPDKTDMV